MNVAKGCLARVGQSADILPDVEKMLQGISYICDHVQGEAMTLLTTCVFVLIY